MTLKEYLTQEAISVLEFSKRCTVSYNTLKTVTRGLRIKQYDIAEEIAKATGYQVTIHDLCSREVDRE
jgi:transcriptional regulator with XRE-family HTH domain